MILYLFLALGLVASHGYSFYKGYEYANQDAIIREQVAKIQHLETSERYYREANNASQNEASNAAKSLEETNRQVESLKILIETGKLGKACSDKLFKELGNIR